MARRKSFSSIMNQIARDQARREREREQQARDHQRHLERARKEAARQQVQLNKEAKQRYLESRVEETEDYNAELNERISDLNQILESTLQLDDTISFESLRSSETYKEFSLPEELKVKLNPPRIENYLDKIKKPSAIERLIPGTERRYQRLLQDAQLAFERAQAEYGTLLKERESTSRRLREEYDSEKQAFDTEVKERNQEVDEFQRLYNEGDPGAVTAYCSMVLERSDTLMDSLKSLEWHTRLNQKSS